MKTSVSIVTGILLFGAASASRADVGVGFAWSSIPPNPPAYPTLLTLPSDNSFNSRLGSIVVSNVARGSYTVTFAGLGTGSGIYDGNDGNVQVVSYGPGNEYCNVDGWMATTGQQSGVSDITVAVKCFSPNGNPADSMFSVYYLRGANSYTTNLEAFDASGYNNLLPTLSRNEWTGSSLPIEIRRLFGVGQYAVSFHEDLRQIGGAMIATALGQRNHCQVGTWSTSRGEAYVYCFGPDGQPVNSKFTILMSQSGPFPSNAKFWGHASVDNTVPGSVWPPAPATSGGIVSFNELAVGQFLIAHDNNHVGLGSNIDFVSANDPAVYCKLERWSTGGRHGTTTTVGCYNAAGVRTNPNGFSEQLINLP